MLRFDVVGTLVGARFRTGAPDVAMVETGQGLRVVNRTGGETLDIALAAGRMAEVAGFSVHGPDRLSVTIGGAEAALPLGTTDLVLAAGAAGHSLPAHLSLPGGVQSATELAGLTVSGQTVIYAAPATGSGLTWLRPVEGGLASFGGLADGSGNLSAISAMAFAGFGPDRYLIAGSAATSVLSVLRVGGDGALSAVFRLGPQDGLPVQSVTALRVVEAWGKTWVIVGAGGSSSLTLLTMAPDGRLTVADQVIDTLGTRFHGVTALDVVSHGGIVFIVAGGADDGVTLLCLLPDGSLQFLATVADATDTRLADISALQARVTGDEIQILVASASEAGMTLLRVGLGELGRIGTATAKADMLIDASGADTLSGGDGADLFVLRADRARDTVADFDPAQDRLDLGRWPFFRDVRQIEVMPTETGAILRFFDEVLELRAGRRLTEAEVRQAILIGTDRIPFGFDPPPEPPPLPTDLRRVGGASGDTLAGGGGNDTLLGEGGDDSLTGGGGNDTVDGGAGHDTLDGGTGADMLDGGAGDDRLEGGDGADALSGGAGQDMLDGGAGDDRLDGGDGMDSLTGGDGRDTLDGGAGDDRLSAGGGDDTVDGGAGNDVLSGGDGSDALTGGAGDDGLSGDAGGDALDGGEGADTMDGGSGNDTLLGGAGNDTLSGGDGEDQVMGATGNDLLRGDAGEDRLVGDLGRDGLWGGAGNDLLDAGPGRDWLNGGEGDDVLSGGSGADWLSGGSGQDRLTGGTGADRFVFRSLTRGEVDVITDFAGNDLIRLVGVAGGSPSARFDALSIRPWIADGLEGAAIRTAGHLIILPGVDPDDLAPSDFLFR